MTREFLEALKREFLEEVNGQRNFILWNFNYEQFRVSRCRHVMERAPSLDDVRNLARDSLKRVKNVYVAQSDALQATEEGDIIIIPGYQQKSQHALALCDLDLKLQVVLFSTSWHSRYGMTPKQIERYVNFAKLYFERF